MALRPHARRVHHRRWPSGLALIGSLLVGMVAWALASPVGSSPDEDFHIANIYCLADESTCRSDDVSWPLGFPFWPADTGDREGVVYGPMQAAYPDLWEYPYLRELPCYVRNGTKWYAPDASVPADCLNAEDPADNTPATLDDLDYYPSAYYPVLSLFTSESIRKSVVAWRLVNIAIALLMAFASLRLSRPEQRRPLGIAWLVSSVPFGLFLMSSVNPSAWAVIGTSVMLGPAIALLTSPWKWRASTFRLAFVAASALMTAGSRSEGIVHVAVATLVVLVLAARPPARPGPRLGLAVGVVGLMLISVFVVSRSGKLMVVLETGFRQGPGWPKIASPWDTLLAAPGVLVQAFSPSLGWLEIGMPAAVGVLASAAFWGACFFGLSVFFRRKLLALALVTPVMVLIPAVALLTSPEQQARYFLPLVYIFAFVMLVTPTGRYLPEMTKAQKGALVLGLSIANSLALLQVTVRYVSGLTMGATNPRAFAAYPVPDWWWDYWLSPFANWVLGTVAFALGCYLLLRNPGPLFPSLVVESPDYLTEPEETSASGIQAPIAGSVVRIAAPTPRT